MTRSLKISNALEGYMTLVEALDDAYWEANDIDRKDRIYDIIAAVNGEIVELNKLSVQDHHYPYEPITRGIRNMKDKLGEFRKGLDQYCIRSRTARNLDNSLTHILNLLD